MSRVIDCPCGHQLRGSDDEELFRLARQHIAEDHPHMPRSDEQMRQTIRERARDELPAVRR